MANLPVSAVAPPPASGPAPRHEADEPDSGGRFGLGAAVFWLEEAPAWLTSGLLHLTALLLLAMLALTASQDEPLLITASLSEDVGEQLAADSLELTAAAELVLEQQVLSPDVSLLEIEDPLVNPLEVPVSPTGESFTSDVPSVTPPGAALTGRTEGRKEALLKANGATAETEAAVALGLEWLKRHQNRDDGSWSLKGKFKNPGASANPEAATGMALLAFQGAGYLPGPSQADYGRVLFRGWKWLLNRQNQDGSFFSGGNFNHRFYTHSICTIALCELFTLTGDEQYREPAQAAVNYLIREQGRLGGWKYASGSGNSDLSVTGWAFMALKSGRLAGLEAPEPVFKRIDGFLDEVARADPPASAPKGSRYVYEATDTFNRERIPAMTAVGLLCREYQGWRMSDERLARGMDFLLEHPPEWRKGKTNTYYWYYASQALLHAGGPQWPKWNNKMREILPANQVRKRSRERGSWYSEDDAWAFSGGRLYMTCMAIYTLEVYYRHLPLYQQEAVKE